MLFFLPDDLLTVIADFVPYLRPLGATCARWDRLLEGWEAGHTDAGRLFFPCSTDWSRARRVFIDWTQRTGRTEAVAPVGLLHHPPPVSFAV